MAGPLTARTMEAQFNPVPFGSYPPPSAFEIAMQEPLWEHFRNIDLDKEARVLQVIARAADSLVKHVCVCCLGALSVLLCMGANDASKRVCA